MLLHSLVEPTGRRIGLHGERHRAEKEAAVEGGQRFLPGYPRKKRNVGILL
jgi:hypothetical protein